jgi:hydroxypyruvate isomerase
MIRFSVCLETIFNALPLGERIGRAAACGAAAVEFWSRKDKDLDEIARAKEAAGVDVAAFVALSDHLPNDPAAADDAADELLASIQAAREIGATGLIITAEQAIESVSREQQIESLARMLDAAAPAAQKAHVTLLLEPLNARIDHPGALLSTTPDTLAIVDEIGRPNVKMLFDIYHQYVTEGTVLASIESHIDRIGHFHLADVPGRGEPGTGAVDFGEVLKLIGSLDYDGFVGLEFFPSADHADAVTSVIQLA